MLSLPIYFLILLYTVVQLSLHGNLLLYYSLQKGRRSMKRMKDLKDTTRMKRKY